MTGSSCWARSSTSPGKKPRWSGVAWKISYGSRRSSKPSARSRGGIAHDFNNLLGAIVGYAELIGDASKDEGQVREDLRELLKAADRGRQLVEHILTFSRRQDVVRRPVALASVLQDATKMLRATLPASIEIRLHVHPGVPRVLADTTSIHQILMNLATNLSARHAVRWHHVDPSRAALRARQHGSKTAGSA